VLGRHSVDSLSEFPWWRFPIGSCSRGDVFESALLAPLLHWIQTQSPVYRNGRENLGSKDRKLPYEHQLCEMIVVLQTSNNLT